MAKLKQIVIVNADLNLSPGKAASQAAHASVVAWEQAQYYDADVARRWLWHDDTLIVCKATEAEMRRLFTALLYLDERSAIPFHGYMDHGVTEVPPKSFTALAIGPAPAEEIDKITGHLELL